MAAHSAAFVLVLHVLRNSVLLMNPNQSLRHSLQNSWVLFCIFGHKLHDLAFLVLLVTISGADPDLAKRVKIPLHMFQLDDFQKVVVVLVRSHLSYIYQVCLKFIGILGQSLPSDSWEHHVSVIPYLFHEEDSAHYEKTDPRRRHFKEDPSNAKESHHHSSPDDYVQEASASVHLNLYHTDADRDHLDHFDHHNDDRRNHPSSAHDDDEVMDLAIVNALQRWPPTVWAWKLATSSTAAIWVISSSLIRRARDPSFFASVDYL